MSQNSIYYIDTWTPSTAYYKNYIVTYNGLYYYSAVDQTSTSNFNTDLTNGLWNGYIYYNGMNYPYFVWKSSYHFTNDSKPRIRKIQFGDSYFQNLPDGINTLLLKYDFTFENRDLHEATAILHFLTARNGTQSFVFLPPAPRGVLSTFKAEEWSDIMEFFNNISIKATFLQSPV
jgi:phage-related protein